MTDTLEINLAARIMLGSSRHGVVDPRRVHVFVRAIMDVIDHRYPEQRPGLLSLEPVITEQLNLLEAALIDARMHRECGAGDAVLIPEAAPGVAQQEDAGKDEEAEEAERKLRRRRLQGKGHTVQAKAMEEKLSEQRAPVQELLRKDCVELGLIDAKRAEKMVRSMVGKAPEEGESLVVEQLRQILQDQVKGIIRRLKGGPWATPQAQEDMRQDIHNARSVRSILMLARQVLKERHAWEKQHGAGLFGGLFGSRKGLGA